MPGIGSMTIKLDADTTSLRETLRIIAKHATALADELSESEPAKPQPLEKI